ncbi:MAG TPA: hypothetical protein VMN78_13620 [Longimicrobiales bacterium]|nr:hypothetical protein [Longimicrobiales bacterium]
MSEAALHWLESRDAAPPALRERMMHWAAASDAEEAPLALGQAALAALQRALELGPARAAALELLAADALVTYACEAAAGVGSEALEQVLDAVGPVAFARLLVAAP